MPRLVLSGLIGLFYLLAFSICCSDCQLENQWTTYGGSGTREFRVFNDNHPFFNGTKPTGTVVSKRYDNSTEVIDPSSLVSVDERYLYSIPSTSVQFIASTVTGETLYYGRYVAAVLLSGGYAFFSSNQGANQVTVFQASDYLPFPEAPTYNMTNGFDWTTMVIGGDGLSLSTALFLWGNDFDNRSVVVDIKVKDMTPMKDVPMRWPSEREKYVVWEENDQYHSIWTTINSNSISFTLTHTTFFPYVTVWKLDIPFFPVKTLYHTRAESFIYLDQEGIKCVDVMRGNITWSYSLPNHKIKQLAASDRKENGHYLYYVNDTQVTFLEFDGNHVQEAKKYSPSDDVIQALSVIHGDDEGEEILFVSGLNNAFYAVSIDGKELFRASGNKCLSPVIFKDNTTFICADAGGVRVFNFQPSPTDDGGGLAAGWIALIVIGSIIGVVVILAVVYFAISSSSKKSGPEMIF